MSITIGDIQGRALLIKKSLNNPKLIDEIRKNFKEEIFNNIIEDKEETIRIIESLKKSGYLYLLNRNNRVGLDVEVEIFQEIPFIIQEDYINENITSYIVLTTNKKMEVEALVPEVIAKIFSVYSEIYERTGLDLNTLWYLADSLAHYSIKTLLYLLDYEKYTSLIDEKRENDRKLIESIQKGSPDTSINITEEPINTLPASKVEKIEIKYNSPDPQKSPKVIDILDSLLLQTREWPNRVNDVVLATGYRELLSNHFQSLGEVQHETFKTLSHSNTLKYLGFSDDYIDELGSFKKDESSVLLLDKITSSLSAGKVPYKHTSSFAMEKKGSNKEITTFVTLNIDDLGDILPDSINSDDISTLEAVISLLKNSESEGIDTFSLNDIHRFKLKNLKSNPNKKQQEQLKEQLLKLMKTLITIDSSQEKKFYYPKLECKYTSNLLNADFLEVSVKGNKTMALKVLAPPILYRYAEAKKQLTNIPFALLDNKLVKTESVLALERYLTRRIVQMRNSPNTSRSIRYSTIYDHMNYGEKKPGTIEKMKNKTRNNTEEILKGFINTKYIKDYSIKKQGKTEYFKIDISL